MIIQPKKSVSELQSYRPEVAKISGQLAGQFSGQKQIRLSVNEGALGVSKKTALALGTIADNVHRYPEQISFDLTKSIADKFGLKQQNIMPGNGSDEIIGLLCTAYLNDGDEAIYTQYGFLVFPQAIRIAGGKPVIAKDNALTVSIDNIITAITEKTRIIFIANPNNPTATMVERREIERLIKKVPKHIIIVLDSAYAEYVTANPDHYNCGSDYVEANENVVMLRTFSKIYGLAALRLGWGYMPENIYQTIAAIRPPFSVNAAASIAGTAAINDTDFIKKSVEHNEIWRQKIQESLARNRFKTLPSVTNFFLIEFENAAAAEQAHQFMASKNIQLRRMKPYGLPAYLRMSIGNDDEMITVDNAFKELAKI